MPDISAPGSNPFVDYEKDLTNSESISSQIQAYQLARQQMRYQTENARLKNGLEQTTAVYGFLTSIRL
ncbi:hypothetical protein [Pseudoduganella sp. R-34]|uniref:hypothetical protein n=1 Tax=unclassified Pseudoduganella TaxID=2637179 RepID=UPI003CF55C7B